jgi:hypothetical protein
MTSIDIHGASLGRDASSSAGRSVRLMVGTPLSYGVWLVAALAAACSSKAGEDGGGSGGNGFIVNSQGGQGSNGTGSTGSGTAIAPAGCSIGSQGCYCDTIGGCVTGLKCQSGLCCDSSSGNCSPSSTSTGSNTGSATGSNTGSTTGSNTGSTTSSTTGTTTGPATALCQPGVIGTLVSNCGYPYASNYALTSTVFNESEVLADIVPTGGSYAVVRVFYGDEHALTLGVRSIIVKSASGSTSTDYPVSALASDPGSVSNPLTGSNVLFGDQAGLDPSLRPMWPALFITDITNDANDRSGDWQYGGRPFNPSAVYGTWKAAVRTVDTTVTPNVATITPDADPAKNNWTLGAGADPVPATIAKNQGYGAEIVWNLALIPGHSYRVQAMVHDGDQNKVGGDSGEACVDFCTSTDTTPPDGGYVPPGGGTPPPPQCQEGSSPCGAGAALTATECPANYICANGCCTWNDSTGGMIY